VKFSAFKQLDDFKYTLRLLLESHGMQAASILSKVQQIIPGQYERQLMVLHWAKSWQRAEGVVIYLKNGWADTDYWTWCVG